MVNKVIVDWYLGTIYLLINQIEDSVKYVEKYVEKYQIKIYFYGEKSK
jgi:hypothetical protein